MSQPEPSAKVYSASVTDRGLNERRPLNEDSFLSDEERCIFAVADGVGGAEAGEVASQTAIEVLDEAFRHQVDVTDVEDLIELAIQRANASIHRMSHEHEKLSQMATTIVALHLKGNTATIAHVGDSRLYLLTPEGQLVRETEDHSIVEEEVRAGRMTPEQAVNHPSKNVISRALGAEETVEVDLKTMEVKNGTCFLLCSDGITRHILDQELKELLIEKDDLPSVCAELKRLCHERGAEDNLTAIVVRLGEPPAERREFLEGRTLSLDGSTPAPASEKKETVFAGNLDTTQDALVPPSRILIPASPAETAPSSPPDKPLSTPDSRRPGGGAASEFRRFLVFLIFLVAVAGAFYGGTRYKGPLPFGLRNASEIPPVQSTPSPDESLLKFEKARREVDRAPAEWLKNEVPKQLIAGNIKEPAESIDPEFLYLYGRALLLTGKNDEASTAFERAIVRAEQSPNKTNETVRREATLALAAVSLKSNKEIERALKRFDEVVARPAGQ